MSESIVISCTDAPFHSQVAVTSTVISPPPSVEPEAGTGIVNPDAHEVVVAVVPARAALCRIRVLLS
jgi:hypothetical protein